MVPPASCIHPGKEDRQRFNILVVGEGGIGKTTFLQTLFEKFATNKLELTHEGSDRTEVIHELGHFDVDSAGDTASYTFHLVDTPGFGDSLNHQEEVDVVKLYIHSKHESWLALDPLLEERERLTRDERIHCAFYCFAPHRVKSLDLLFLQQIQSLVPIIPIVTKADAMLRGEKVHFLQEVKEALENLSQDATFSYYKLDSSCASTDETIEPESEKAADHDTAIQLADDGVTNRADIKATAFRRMGEDLQLDSTRTHSVDRSCEEGKFDMGRDYQITEGPQNSALEGDTTCRQSDGGESSDSVILEFSEQASQSCDEATDCIGKVLPDKCNVINTGSDPLEVDYVPDVFALVCHPSLHRSYPWGECFVNDPMHSDFQRLHSALFNGGHIVLLKRLTQKMSIDISKSSRPLVALPFSIQFTMASMAAAFGILLGVVKSVPFN